MSSGSSFNISIQNVDLGPESQIQVSDSEFSLRIRIQNSLHSKKSTLRIHKPQNFKNYVLNIYGVPNSSTHNFYVHLRVMCYRNIVHVSTHLFDMCDAIVKFHV